MPAVNVVVGIVWVYSRTSVFLCFAGVLAELDCLKNNIIKLHNYPAKAIAIQQKY